MLINEVVVPALLGGTVGAALALTGAGGGVLAVPLLVFVLGLGLTQAAPVALLSVLASSGVGAWLGWREGVLRYRAAALMGLGGLLTAPLGVRVAHALPPAPLALCFVAVLLLTSRRMWALPPAAAELGEGGGPACRIAPGGPRLRWTPDCAVVLAVTGAVAGFLSGLLGVGGGFVIVPALSRATNLDGRSIATTSIATIALVSLGGLASGLSVAAVPVGVALSFSLASLAALLWVRRLTRHAPGTLTRRAFALLCLVAAAMLAWRAWQWWGLGPA